MPNRSSAPNHLRICEAAPALDMIAAVERYGWEWQSFAGTLRALLNEGSALQAVGVGSEAEALATRSGWNSHVL
jgi:hypothetical protein